MKEYSGEYLELGPSQQSGQWWHYSYVKIDTEIIKNVYIKEKFNVILRDQTKRDGHVKLWIINWFFKPLIIGITQADGQTFRQGLFTLYASLAAITIGTVAALSLGIYGYYFLPLGVLGFVINFRLIQKVKKVPADHVF